MSDIADSLDRIVQDGVCIGCGLCAAVSGGAVRMAFTPEMRERPVCSSPLSNAAMESIRASCPGLVVEGLSDEEAGPDAIIDPMWETWHHAFIAWAADPEVRHCASAGGVLSALSAYLLRTNQVDFILHVGPDPERPIRSRWKISRTVEEALDTGGSHYRPAAPLAGLAEAKKMVEGGAHRFAFVGKPCDISAIRLLAHRETWLADSLVLRTPAIAPAKAFTTA
jgi:coenzyme F420 hydrogenase subunit beta